MSSPSATPATPPARGILDQLARAALAEDHVDEDVTTKALIPEGTRAEGVIHSRESGIQAGLPMARAVFEAVDPQLEFRGAGPDGRRLEEGTEVCRVRGSARSILMAERTALNFLQRLCGIATLTSRFVEAVGNSGARILDTRKTTPGLRAVEKYAVVCGGGANHRFDLSDGFMLKDNHRAVLDRRGVSLVEALTSARDELPPDMPLEVEVDDPARIVEVLEAGADILLLDNFTVEQLRAAVDRVGDRALLEASGGVTLETVRSIAETGVDRISVGALTHSAPALDLGMDFGMEP